jgi:polyhydroxybutyrate depolymerase
MSRLYSLAVVSLLLPMTMVWAEDAKKPLPATIKPGQFTLDVESGKLDRVAQIHVPKGYKADTKPPLVLLLHGGGGSGTSALDTDGWAAKADKEGFFVVAPEGLGSNPKLPANFKTNPAIWNSGQYPARSPIAAIDDIAFITKLLDTLKEKLPHDESRVFCTGHSNGGGMTFRVAAELSDRFAAIGMVAGRLAVDKPKPKKPLPTLYIVGTKDPLMPLEGGDVKSPWGGTWKNRAVADQLADWADAIGSEKEPKQISDTDGVRKLEYPATKKGATLRVLYLEGHGHQWPGGKRTLPESVVGPIKSKLVATDSICEFFKASVPEKK